jgi:hypothetical protein
LRQMSPYQIAKFHYGDEAWKRKLRT